ncbi:gem-associated protein 7 (Gemin7) domain-containing protein [Phthorimaea operculella]|nr:gem-associated protein 7 (Gemin7) domain-containing protein [Phthorimaea operculella]
MITGDNSMSPDTATKSKQEARVKLRETFLKALTELNGERCSILTFEKSLLEATFSGWKVEGDEILVKDLKTPSVDVAAALLRTPDILAIQFKNQVQLP